MIINMANLQSKNFLNRNSITNKFLRSGTVNVAGIKGTQDYKEESSVLLSISKEAKEAKRTSITEQLEKNFLEEKKIYDEKISKESDPANEDKNKSKEKGGMENSENWQVINLEDIADIKITYQTDSYRLVSAAFDNGDNEGNNNSPRFSTARLGSEYDKMKKELEEQYSGPELTKRLISLEKSYDEAVDHITEQIAIGIRYAALTRGKEGVASVLKFYGITTKDFARTNMEGILGKMDSEGGMIIDNAYDSIVKDMQDFIRRSAAQYKEEKE